MGRQQASIQPMEIVIAMARINLDCSPHQGKIRCRPQGSETPLRFTPGHGAAFRSLGGGWAALGGASHPGGLPAATWDSPSASSGPFGAWETPCGRREAPVAPIPARQPLLGAHLTSCDDRFFKLAANLFP